MNAKRAVRNELFNTAHFENHPLTFTMPHLAHVAERHRRSGACHADPLGLGPCRFKPTSHFIAGAIEYKKAVGRCVGVFASHLWKPRLAGLHDLVQVLEGTVLDLNWLNFVPMNNPFNTKHCLLSSPHFAREALRRRLLLPIWAHVGAGRVLGLHEWPPLPPRSRPIVDFADGHPVVRGYVK